MKVLDGGALLQKIPWEKHSLFKDIAQKYASYVQKNYGSPTIVFDRYGSASSKDMTHKRRKKGLTGIEVTLHENSSLMTSKEVFLSNKRN